MASHLHFYINGTIGAQDGTEIDITKAINLGQINSYSNITTNPSSNYKYYPPIAIPIFLRMETGFEISEGTLKVGYYDITTGSIGAIGGSHSSPHPQLFHTETTLKAALDANYIDIAHPNGTPIYIKSANKITDVNCCLFLIAMYIDASKASELYPVDLIDFSFTETAVTP